MGLVGWGGGLKFKLGLGYILGLGYRFRLGLPFRLGLCLDFYYDRVASCIPRCGDTSLVPIVTILSSLSACVSLARSSILTVSDDRTSLVCSDLVPRVGEDGRRLRRRHRRQRLHEDLRREGRHRATAAEDVGQREEQV